MVTPSRAIAIADRPLSACADGFITAVDVIAYCDRLQEVFQLRSSRGDISALCNAIIAAECARDFGDDSSRMMGGLAFLDAVVVLLRDRLTGACNRRISGLGRRA